MEFIDEETVKEHDGMIGIVHNVCYGGFGLSIAASRELKDCGSKGSSEISSDYFFGTDSGQRHDQRLVDLIVQRGLLWASGSSSKLAIKWIDVKYSNYYHIDEYDGWETVNIDHDNFKISRIKQILDDVISSDLKVEQIRSCLD